ncbi:MAG: hypothetical protein J1F42_00735 [Lachnospiraceae bacterium]|nr:hypothetical protein [Lachnospiraceae bacterium]
MNQKSIVIYKTWQINIPEDFIMQLGIQEGNTLSCLLEDNEIRLRPEKSDKDPIKYSTASATSLPHTTVSKHPTFQREFRIQCFGNMSVSRNGEQVIFQNKKAKELIAYLLCNGGGPIKNTALAEILWPDTPFTNAMDSLYKVNRYLRNLRMGEESFPIIMEHGEIYLDCRRLCCDLHEFEELYQQREHAEAWGAAVELYRGSVFYDEYYDWIAPYEAYYDIRFLEMTGFLITYYEQAGNRETADYYRLKQDR